MIRSQLTINTAIVYMHRFYMIQSFTRFHRNVCALSFDKLFAKRSYELDRNLTSLLMSYVAQVIAPAALFLAAKVEEQPRKLEHVIKVTHACLNPQDPSPDTRSDVSTDSIYVRWPLNHLWVMLCLNETY